ncbi:hypothetical protein BR93DRAFT_927668 [Coniochaeta sp. PMI_546]|nr:hypothetical protein BR93DRAFT_927668 [Coniochaeta sp. PMI_546]
MLHEGILALTYETNNVKCQKELFGELSPALSAAEFDTQRTTFKNAKVKLSQQRASFDIRVGAVGTADIPAAFITSSWKDFLLQDLQVPFHVPPTLEELKDYHRIRIRGV